MIEVRRATLTEVADLRQCGGLQGTYMADRDIVIVALLDGLIVASGMIRPMWWVHGLDTLEMANGATRMQSAQAVLNYGLGFTDGFRPPDTLPLGLLFQLDQGNGAMIRWLRGPSFVTEPEGTVIIRRDNFNPNLEG